MGTDAKVVVGGGSAVVIISAPPVSQSANSRMSIGPRCEMGVLSSGGRVGACGSETSDTLIHNGHSIMSRYIH